MLGKRFIKAVAAVAILAGIFTVVIDLDHDSGAIHLAMADQGKPGPGPDRLMRLYRRQKGVDMDSLRVRLGLPAWSGMPKFDRAEWMSRSDVDSGKTGQPVSILKTADSSLNNWQLIAFYRASKGWNVAGSLELPRQSGFAPRVEWISSPMGKPWLSVLHLSAPSVGGSDPEEETWLAAGSSGLRQVVRFPEKGAIQNDALNLLVRYELQQTKQFKINNQVRLELQYEVSYFDSGSLEEGLDMSGFLFATTYTTRYLWLEQEQRFELEPDNSDLSASLWGDEPDFSVQPVPFLASQYANLLEIARGTDASRKRWLLRLLADCPPGREKEALLQGMEGSDGLE